MKFSPGLIAQTPPPDELEEAQQSLESKGRLTQVTPEGTRPGSS